MLYDLLRRQVPHERIHMGKKVINVQQTEDHVEIEFQDGSTASGDILVGADGAYSVVRQKLYAHLKGKNQLPASDAVPLPFSTVCLVGQTRPLDPEVFPNLKIEGCQFIRTLGDNKPYTVSDSDFHCFSFCFPSLA